MLSGMMKCKRCKKLIERTSNNRKYCTDCSDKIAKQSSLYRLREWRVNNPERDLAIKRKAKYVFYGTTEEKFKQQLIIQNNKCAICEKTFSPDLVPCVDHDHSCCPLKAKCCGKCNRDLLCRPCNFILGLSKDSPEVLEKSAQYLRRHTKKIELGLS
jgi:hypothetical protein